MVSYKEAEMIIIQTPLRLSLFGGGTDFPSFYKEHGGCVLTTAIDKYIFITIKNRFDDKLRVGYTKTEMIDQVDQIEHELIRESFRMTGISKGVEITTMGDIPSAGSGLGSSSTVTVGALHAMYSYLGETVTAEKLAREACKIEIEVLNKPIGIQDQYIVAYGGLRFIEFNGEENVLVNKIKINDAAQRQLNDNLMLFYTGIARQSASILAEQEVNISQKISTLNQLKSMAQMAKYELEEGNVDAIGEMLNESWELKKGLAQKISNGRIDEIYKTAKKGGALGGKISGAGGGGFMMLYCPYENQSRVRKMLGLQELPFRFEADGSKVIFNYRR